MADTKDILEKYSKRIEEDLGFSSLHSSSDYLRFKEEMIPSFSKYEKWAKSLGNIIKIRVAEKDRSLIEKYLQTAHLEINASQSLTLAIMSFLLFFTVTILVAASIYLINGSLQILFVFLGLIASAFVFYYAYSMPQRLANSWRLQASSQMVPAILYIVVYMKHTSNLERAIAFAAEHLEGPLALDFKKVFYDVEIGKFATMRQSLASYLEGWQEYAPEFVESFHLIESSLYEPSEIRRVQILEKSLQIILDGIYEKMLKYSREIRSPLTNIYMLGIILPTLALALLPLASTLLGGILQWQHVFIIFNVIIPFMVFYLTSEILLKRPGGYGESSVMESNPEYYKYASKKPYFKAFLIAFPLFIIGILPFIFQIAPLTDAIGLKSDYKFSEIGLGFESFADSYVFDFKKIPGNSSRIGPFGLIGVLLSLFIPLSIALFFSLSYKIKTKELIIAREKTKKLEEEFTNSLFQFGNRLADGIPAEVAFAKVSESTQGQITQKFFSIVNINIQQAGMSLERAIFDKKRGAIIYYPSALIATSMKILVESVKKGLQVASKSLMSISDYVKNIQKINQRLRDLLAEVISDMRSNMAFLAPLLAGIVVGLSSMIILILNKLQGFQEAISSSDTAAGLGSFGAFNKIFALESMIPPYFMQVTIGIYIIEIIFILSSALVTVDSGKDKLKEKYDISKYLKSGMIIYLATALFSILALSLLAALSLSSL